MSFRRWCPYHLGEIDYQAVARGLLGEETWFLCAHILPSSRRFLICCEILDTLRIVRLEGGGYINEYELAFLRKSQNDLGHGIFNPSVFSSAPNQAHQARTDFKS